MKLNFQSFSKNNRFNDLVESVRHCELCERLCERTKVLSESNGDIETKILFVAEAPGRLGADRTGIPLFGDKTGDNFEKLLGNIGWKREQVFITNAILCNPQQENSTNGTPTSEEIANCSVYLEMVITLVRPEIVVSLGIIALKALDLISPHGIQLREGIAKQVPWFGSSLFPLYHPGPRALIHRSLAKQRSDFMLLAKLGHPKNGLLVRKKPRTKTMTVNTEGTTPLQQVARAFLELGRRMTYFKLTKLLYLFDLQSIRSIGRTVASDIYLRQVEGPWPPNLDEALQNMDGFEVRRYFLRRLPMVDIGPSPRTEVKLDDNILEIVVEVFGKFGGLSNSRIKTAVYRTEPMRFILEEENKGKDMRNNPVLYKEKTAIEM